MYVRACVRMYVRTHVRTYVCTYVYTYKIHVLHVWSSSALQNHLLSGFNDQNPRHLLQ